MANLQRIRTGSTGALTPRERESLHELVKEYNSDFRTKAATVDDVSKIKPEAGAIVISDHDGRMYYADEYGWHLEGAAYSPILLFVDFTDTQFDFKFKAPSTSTLVMNDGDGTMTAVAGQDDVEVTHTTTYAAPGTYTFYVEGDYVDLTYINIINIPFISGDVSRWSEVISLVTINIPNTIGLEGDITSWYLLTNLEFVSLTNCSLLTGDVAGWSVLTNLDSLGFRGTTIASDISSWAVLDNLEALILDRSLLFGDVSLFGAGNNNLSTIFLYETALSFENLSGWPDSIGIFRMYDCNLTSTEVDLILNSLAINPPTGIEISIAGNNAARTSASDAAMITLEAAGNTVTVNE